MPAPLVVRCYDAAYAPEVQKFHLVLEDVSASHVQATVWPLPPVEAQCVQAIDCLAQLHAHWWDHASLAQDMGARPTEASMQQAFRRVEQTLPGFLDFLGDRLSKERRAVYERTLRVAPLLPWPRVSPGSRRTWYCSWHSRSGPTGGRWNSSSDN